MRRSACVTAVVLLLSVFAASGGAAAPGRDGPRSSLVLSEDGAPAFFLVSPFGSPTPSFLPSAACAFSPARSASLSAEVRDLHANLHGTVADLGGSVYAVSGTFREANRTPPFPGVAFFGTGHLTISGPRGVVSGEARFVDVEAGPPEWDFYFTRIEACRIR